MRSREEKKYDKQVVLNKKELMLSIVDRKNVNNIFVALLSFFININDNETNGLFSFFEFDRVKTSIEIQFLEYYRALEFMDTEARKKKGKGKNKTFMLGLLNKYSSLKVRYFKTKTDKEIEEEIRSLRNYYSHSGYYVDVLPIPTDNPTRYLNVDLQWKYDVRTFAKVVAYLELFSNANVSVNEKTFPTNL